MANWNSHVNTNFYGLDSTFIDNTKEVSFASGRKIKYLKNTTPKKRFSFMLSVDDKKRVEGKTEFEWFLYWYENEVYSGTESFKLLDFITHSALKDYILDGVPTWKGQAIKEISLSIEEL